MTNLFQALVRTNLQKELYTTLSPQAGTSEVQAALLDGGFYNLRETKRVLEGHSQLYFAESPVVFSDIQAGEAARDAKRLSMRKELLVRYSRLALSGKAAAEEDAWNDFTTFLETEGCLEDASDTDLSMAELEQIYSNVTNEVPARQVSAIIEVSSEFLNEYRKHAVGLEEGLAAAAMEFHKSLSAYFALNIQRITGESPGQLADNLEQNLDQAQADLEAVETALTDFSEGANTLLKLKNLYTFSLENEHIVDPAAIRQSLVALLSHKAAFESAVFYTETQDDESAPFLDSLTDENIDEVLSGLWGEDAQTAIDDGLFADSLAATRDLIAKSLAVNGGWQEGLSSELQDEYADLIAQTEYRKLAAQIDQRSEMIDLLLNFMKCNMEDDDATGYEVTASDFDSWRRFYEAAETHIAADGTTTAEGFETALAGIVYRGTAEAALADDTNQVYGNARNMPGRGYTPPAVTRADRLYCILALKQALDAELASRGWNQEALDQVAANMYTDFDQDDDAFETELAAFSAEYIDAFSDTTGPVTSSTIAQTGTAVLQTHAGLSAFTATGGIFNELDAADYIIAVTTALAEQTELHENPNITYDYEDILAAGGIDTQGFPNGANDFLSSLSDFHEIDDNYNDYVTDLAEKHDLAAEAAADEKLFALYAELRHVITSTVNEEQDVKDQAYQDFFTNTIYASSFESYDEALAWESRVGLDFGAEADPESNDDEEYVTQESFMDTVAAGLDLSQVRLYSSMLSENTVTFNDTMSILVSAAGLNMLEASTTLSEADVYDMLSFVLEGTGFTDIERARELSEAVEAYADGESEPSALTAALYTGASSAAQEAALVQGFIDGVDTSLLEANFGTQALDAFSEFTGGYGSLFTFSRVLFNDPVAYIQEHTDGGMYEQALRYAVLSNTAAGSMLDDRFIQASYGSMSAVLTNWENTAESGIGNSFTGLLQGMLSDTMQTMNENTGALQSRLMLTRQAEQTWKAKQEQNGKHYRSYLVSNYLPEDLDADERPAIGGTIIQQGNALIEQTEDSLETGVLCANQTSGDSITVAGWDDQEALEIRNNARRQLTLLSSMLESQPAGDTSFPMFSMDVDYTALVEKNDAAAWQELYSAEAEYNIQAETAHTLDSASSAWNSLRGHIASIKKNIRFNGYAVDLIASGLDDTAIDDQLEVVNQAQTAVSKKLATYDTVLSEYNAVNTDYDEAYTNVKDMQEAYDSAAFAFRKAEAVYEFAQSGYLKTDMPEDLTEEEVGDDPALAENKVDPLPRLYYVLDKYNRAYAAQSALATLYDDDDTAKAVFELGADTEYDQLFSAYREGFRNSIAFKKIQSVLGGAIAEQKEVVAGFESDQQQAINDVFTSGLAPDEPESTTTVDNITDCTTLFDREGDLDVFTSLENRLADEGISLYDYFTNAALDQNAGEDLEGKPSWSEDRLEWIQDMHDFLPEKNEAAVLTQWSLAFAYIMEELNEGIDDPDESEHDDTIDGMHTVEEDFFSQTGMEDAAKEFRQRKDYLAKCKAAYEKVTANTEEKALFEKFVIAHALGLNNHVDPDYQSDDPDKVNSEAFDFMTDGGHVEAFLLMETAAENYQEMHRNISKNLAKVAFGLHVAAIAALPWPPTTALGVYLLVVEGITWGLSIHHANCANDVYAILGSITKASKFMEENVKNDKAQLINEIDSTHTITEDLEDARETLAILEGKPADGGPVTTESYIAAVAKSFEMKGEDLDFGDEVIALNSDTDATQQDSDHDATQQDSDPEVIPLGSIISAFGLDEETIAAQDGALDLNGLFKTAAETSRDESHQDLNTYLYGGDESGDSKQEEQQELDSTYSESVSALMEEADGSSEGFQASAEAFIDGGMSLSDWVLSVRDDASLQDGMDMLETALDGAFSNRVFSQKQHLERMYGMYKDYVDGLGYSSLDSMNEEVTNQLGVRTSLTQPDTAGESLAALYMHRLEHYAETKEILWNQRTTEFNEKREKWEATMAAIRNRGVYEFRLAQKRLEIERDQWRDSFEENYEERAFDWDEKYLALMQAKNRWVTQSTEESLEVGQEYVIDTLGVSADEMIAEVDGLLIEDMEDPRSLVADAFERFGVQSLVTGLLERARTMSKGINKVNTSLNKWAKRTEFSDAELKGAVNQVLYEQNEELEERIAAITLDRVLDSLEEARDGMYDQIKSANEGMDRSMTKMLVGAGYVPMGSGSGVMFTRQYVATATVSGPVFETQTIQGYEYFEYTGSIQYDADLFDEQDMEGIDSRGLYALMDTAMSQMQEHMELIFGEEGAEDKPVEQKYYEHENKYKEVFKGYDTVQTGQSEYKEVAVYEQVFIGRARVDDVVDGTRSVNQSPGLFGAHVGFAAEFKEGIDVEEAVENLPQLLTNYSNGAEIQEDGNEYLKFAGSGEMGRLMLTFQLYQMQEGAGWAEVNKPVFEKKLWDDRDMWMKAPSVRDIVDIGVTIAATAVGGGPLVALMINLSDDLLFEAVAVGAGDRDMGEAAQAFGKKALVSAATTAVSGVFNGLGDTGWFGETLDSDSFWKEGLDGLFDMSGGDEIMTDVLLSAGQQTLTSTTSAFVNSVDFSKLGTEDWFNKDAFMDAMSYKDNASLFSVKLKKFSHQHPCPNIFFRLPKFHLTPSE